MYKSLKELNEAIRSCNKCSLCNDKNNKVITGKSPKSAKIPIKLLIVGEASGDEESKQGIPFVGRAGKMVDEWLKVIKVENYAITNVVKNRPTDGNRNRTPTDEEIEACSPWLFNQIELLKPEIILCLGSIAFKTITKSDDKIGESLKKEYKYKDSKVLTYWHPAYILRNLASIDWQKDIEVLAERITGLKQESASALSSNSGVKNMLLNKELKEINKSDTELSYPLIGMRTEYSLMNFGGKFDNQIKYLIKHGAKSVVICDDNTTTAFLKSNKLKEFGIKVLYGANISYIGLNFSLIVENFEGYKNLNKIVSFVNTNDENYLKDDFLTKVLSNCSEGLRLVIQSSVFDVNLNYNNIFKIFKKKYIGISNNNLKSKTKAYYLSKQYDIPIIVFIDNKFISPDYYDVYLTIKAIKNHSNFADTKIKDRDSKSYIPFLSEFNIEKEIFENSQKIIDEINFEIPSYHNLLPEISNKTNEEKEIYFRELVSKKDLTEDIKRYSEDRNISFDEAKKIYDKRIEEEIQMISSKEFIDYFLIVKDIYDYTRSKNKTISSGRGSAGGSLCAYCLGIIEIDPIFNYLLFERFINESRIELPDIDCDFQPSFRDEIIEYLINKYGKNKVVHAGTLLTFKETSALADVGKVLGIPKYHIDEMKGLLIKRTSGDERKGYIIESTIETMPKFREYMVKYPEFFNIVEKIEGQHKSVGTHASGVILFKDDYYNYVSLLKTNKGYVTSFEFPEMEKNGILKLDILGVSAYDLIDIVTKKNNIKVNYSDPNNNKTYNTDEDVFKLIRDMNTAGIFQLSTHLMTNMGADTIFDFRDIIALNSYCRPSAIRNGIPALYRKFRKTGTPYSIGSKIADELLKGYGFEKYGNMILFQEQVMIIFNKVANFYSTNSMSAIKSIGKSKGIVSFFEQYGKLFIDGAVKNGLTESEADEIFKKIFQMGSYAYNLSHSTLYSYTIYYTAWLKTKFPEDFYIASYKISNANERNNLISEMITRGYKVNQPDVNISDAEDIKYEKSNNTFYLPLSEIKYISEKQINKIIELRKYESLEDLFSKINFTERIKNNIISTCSSGDFNSGEAIKGIVKLPVLISYKDEINKKIEEITGHKPSTIKELIKNKREGWYVAILYEKPKFTSIGDWLPLTEKPTQEQIEKDPKYSIIKKYGWMRKWAKIMCKDTEGTDSYVRIYPDVYDKYFYKLYKLEIGQVLFMKVKTGKDIASRHTLIELITFKENSDNNGNNK